MNTFNSYYFSNAINHLKTKTMQTAKNKATTIRLKPSLLEKIEELSKEENRSFNNTIETLLLRATGSLK